jgi:DNA-binding transcriptional MerR regulator
MIDENLIPEKSIFKSSEVCEILGVKPYILRFWESEFVEISSIVSSSGKKLYERKEIVLISIIKDLLFDKKLTLEKAKQEISKVDLTKILLDSSMILDEEVSSEVGPPIASSESTLGQGLILELLSSVENILSHSSLLKRRYQWN